MTNPSSIPHPEEQKVTSNSSSRGEPRTINSKNHRRASAPQVCDQCGEPGYPGDADTPCLCCDACEGTGNGAVHGVEGECNACNGSGRASDRELAVDPSWSLPKEFDLVAPPTTQDRESATERFERLAEKFFRETGLMAPGKDVPPGMGQPEYGFRWAAYMNWLSRTETNPTPSSPTSEPEGPECKCGQLQDDHVGDGCMNCECPSVFICGNSKPPQGWTCGRVLNHEGPCAALPVPPTSEPIPASDQLREALNKLEASARMTQLDYDADAELRICQSAARAALEELFSAQLGEIERLRGPEDWAYADYIAYLENELASLRSSTAPKGNTK